MSRTLFSVLQTSKFVFVIVEFDVDDELPDDEEIERRFSTLLVSWIRLSSRVLVAYIYAAHDR